jgi:hypothetical protein
LCLRIAIKADGNNFLANLRCLLPMLPEPIISIRSIN